MLRSTLGTWVNYTTTIALQILFASRFGSSAEASGYLISFALVIAIGAVFVSTAQSLYVPRLVSLEGLVLSRGLRKIGCADDLGGRHLRPAGGAGAAAQADHLRRAR